ncbi:MAG: hypothetical protein Fur0010_25850 [Bdellovibrio sp.]
MVLLLFLIQTCSCSKEGPKFTQLQIIDMARKIEPDLEEVQFDLNKTDDPHRVICKNYGAGCVPNTGKRLKIRKVQLIILEFENEEAAKEEAMRINQWYSKNWLFDNVTDEPVLIDFVKKAFDARPGNEAQESKK